MKTILKTTLLLLSVLIAMSAGAHDFEVDGIYYKKGSGNTASVTYKGASYSEVANEYSGDVVIPETVTYDGINYSVTSIGSHAFYGCAGLTSVEIPNSVTLIGSSAFHGCTGLTSVEIPNTVTSISSYAFYVCVGLTSVEIPNTVTSIGSSAFDGCTGLTSVEIPNSVTTIGSFAFSGCTGLTSVEIPSSVSSIGASAFLNCSRSLISIHVESDNPNYDSRNECNALIESETNTLILGCQNTVIPNTITAIGKYAFQNCSALTSIVIPSSVTSIGDGAFWNCNSLTRVDINDLESWLGIHFGNEGSNPLSRAHHLFVNGEEITKLVIPPTVTNIGNYVLYYCDGLTSIDIPNTVTSIGEKAFAYCSNLTTVEIASSVTYIGIEAFKGSNKISSLMIVGEGEWPGAAISCACKNVYLDSRLTSVNGMSVKPTHVYCYTPTPPACDENAFTDYSGTLHVPSTSIAMYFMTPCWSNFTNIAGDVVEPESVSLSNDVIEMLASDQYSLTATVAPADATPNTVLWKSTNPDIAKVDNGTVTAISIGECDIIASCMGKQAVCHVTVSQSTVILTLDQDKVSVLPNHIVEITPSASTDILPELAVTSDDPTIAGARVMNGKVQVVGIKEGTTTIIVSSADGTAQAATCLVTVYTEVGDLSGDGFVNISDVTKLIDYLLDADVTGIYAHNADTNMDGDVNIADVTALIDFLLGDGVWPWDGKRFKVNGVVFNMVEVEGGTFTMGATEEQGSDAEDDEYPTHQVTLQNYRIGETEVTQALWEAVMGYNPSDFTGDPNRPVDHVNWVKCQEFVEKLNELTGENFRLPTEAEWEFAARGGNNSQHYKYAGSNDIEAVAWFKSNSNNQTHAVRTKQANELGLYDMSGNVMEWCQEEFYNYDGSSLMQLRTPDFPYRILRGGAWESSAAGCRVSFRTSWDEWNAPENRYGFRLAL